MIIELLTAILVISTIDLLHKSLLALDTLLAEVNKTVLLQKVYCRVGNIRDTLPTLSLWLE